jgi:hypothetical protein
VLDERPGRLSRGAPNRSTKRRLGRKVNDETTAACRSSERAFMNAKFARELIKRERLCVSHMLGQAHRDSLDDATRDGSEAAIPHAKRIHGHTKELGALLLRQVGVATQLAKRVHVFTMPFIPKFIKRPPEYQTGTHTHFSSSSPHSEKCDNVIC